MYIHHCKRHLETGTGSQNQCDDPGRRGENRSRGWIGEKRRQVLAGDTRPSQGGCHISIDRVRPGRAQAGEYVSTPLSHGLIPTPTLNIQTAKGSVKEPDAAAKDQTISRRAPQRFRASKERPFRRQPQSVGDARSAPTSKIH